MCLTFFYLNPHPKEGTFSLILVFNRDEFFNRETEPAAWKDGVLAGRDMASGKEGGTWLAMSRDGKLGFLTNLYTGVAVQGEGRGFLIGDFLSSDGTAKSYLTALASSDRDFSPFNLCLMEYDNVKKLYNGMHYTRSREGCPLQSEGPTTIEQTIYGLGNHPLSTPFQKTVRGKEAFEKVVRDLNRTEKKADLEKSLFDMMCTSQSNLPDSQMDLQGSKSAFRSFHDKLSSIFVEMSDKNYGTRMQTVVLVDFDGNVTFVERTRPKGVHNDVTYSKCGTSDWKEERYEFKIEKS